MRLGLNGGRKYINLLECQIGIQMSCKYLKNSKTYLCKFIGCEMGNESGAQLVGERGASPALFEKSKKNDLILGKKRLYFVHL